VRAVDVDPNQPLTRPLHAAEVLAAHGAIKQARQVAAKLKETRGDALADTERRQLLKLDARLSMAEGADSDETAAVLDEIVRLDPLDGDALMMLARHWSRQNDQDRAILYYERAESVSAFEVNARIGHAQALVALGRYGDALPLLRRAQELRPRDDVARYLEQVERFAKAH
jgi:tetratricopeptide (TPR) repeat protein